MLHGFIGYPASWRGTNNRIVRVFDFPPLPHPSPTFANQPGNALRSSKLLRRRRLVSIDFWYRPNYTRPPPPPPRPPIHFEDDEGGDRSLLISGWTRDRRVRIREIQFNLWYRNISNILKMIETRISSVHGKIIRSDEWKRNCLKKKKNTNIVSHTRLNAQFRHSEKQNASHDCESNRGKNRTTSGYIYIYIYIGTV